MTKNKIPTGHLDINNSTIYVCDVVRFSNEIFVVKYDKFFHPVNPNFDNGKHVRSTSKPIENLELLKNIQNFLYKIVNLAKELFSFYLAKLFPTKYPLAHAK